MCLRCTKALLKWSVLCLMYSWYYMWNSLEVKQPYRTCETFAYLYFHDLLLQPWKKLWLTFMVISPTCTHLRRKSHMQSDTHSQTNTISSDWQHRGYRSRHWRKCAYFFPLLQGRKREWWKESCVLVGGQHRHNPSSENDWPQEQPSCLGRSQIECMAAL